MHLSHLIYNKADTAMQSRKDILFFLINGTGSIWIKKEWILTHIFHNIQITFIWTVDLHVKGKIINILGDKIREYFHYFGLGRDFINRTGSAQRKELLK